jgi:hypothetical protein
VGDVTAAVGRTLTQNAAWSLTSTGATAFGPQTAPLRANGASVFSQDLGYEALDFSHVRGIFGGTEYLDFLPQGLDVSPSNFARSVLPDGKQWVAIDLGGSLEHAYPRLVEQVETLDPRFLLDELSWGATGVTLTHSEVVNHLPLVRYTVSIDLARALAAAKQKSAAVGEQRAIAEELAFAGTRPVEMTIWVDGPGHVAQLRAEVPGSGLGTVLFAISNFGVKLSPSLPPAAQVVPFAQLRPHASRPPLEALGVSPR